MFLILLVFSLFFIKKYYKSKHKKYLLFLLFCVCGIFNRNNMIYINGIEINNTIYVEIFTYIILATIVIFGYKLYKKKELF
ncbi:hypothetical protein CHL78_007405 [Romboutsia weinsteinii]|uniref:Uncharacterized protein n=1 Tax=Romboutsia weinsteinii TaxID=2020949 RepID=A0A371J516_9FIRM|nr:hypothetical protein [Romboutsia weinsteinii]RDY27825.1 hypothetical protein CHL78_007405 [Romboutsia weinsteinii]